MKQVFVIAFAVFYFTVSSGFLVNVHSCGGEVQTLKIIAEIGENCCSEIAECLNPSVENEDDACCDHEQDENCCDTDSDFVQFDTYRNHLELQNPLKVLKFKTSGIAALLTPEQLSISSLESDFTPVNSEKPDKQPAWLMHCSLMFYG